MITLLTKPLNFLLFLSVIHVSVQISGQTVLNSGFEQWEDANGILMPDHWETSNNPQSMSYPVSAHRTDGACSDMYSLKLTSTAPSLEGPGPGFATQQVPLSEPATTAILTFNYSADTLLEGAIGKIHLKAFDNSNEKLTLVAQETLEITGISKGCTNGSIILESTVPFNLLEIELRAEPSFIPLGTEGLSVVRFDQIDLNVALSTENCLPEDQLGVLPNPTKGVVNLQHTNLRISQLQLMDLSGKVLKHYPPLQNQIDLGEFPAATYLLKIVTDKGATVKKVIKE